jgi:Restriction endonuclease BamHI
MKLNGTFILINRGRIAESAEWSESHAAIVRAISAMSWKPGNADFRIPRIVTIKPGNTYTNLKGKQVSSPKKNPVTLRNGVRPLRDAFRKLMEAQWKCEEPLKLDAYFKTRRGSHESETIFQYPSLERILEPLHEGLGNFDFWLRTRSGFRAVVEWETGNISSSHRSLNKMCLALLGGLVEAAVLIVPSARLYVHLTDRIGNIRELQPYFYFWSGVGQLVERGLLAVVEVEHDALFESTDLRDFIPRGKGGNSPRKG